MNNFLRSAQALLRGRSLLPQIVKQFDHLLLVGGVKLERTLATQSAVAEFLQRSERLYRHHLRKIRPDRLRLCCS
jgi:hypothetical protein